MHPHEPFIEQAIALSQAAVASGNHPFGALLVKDGAVILTAQNSVHTDHDPTRHAELNLVSQAARQFDPPTLAQCTLYTSTEPCAMCTGAIVWGGIRRIVYACSAETLGQITGHVTFVVPSRTLLSYAHNPPEVVGPILEAQAAAVHWAYWPAYLSGSSSS